MAKRPNRSPSIECQSELFEVGDLVLEAMRPPRSDLGIPEAELVASDRSCDALTPNYRINFHRGIIR